MHEGGVRSPASTTVLEIRNGSLYRVRLGSSTGNDSDEYRREMRRDWKTARIERVRGTERVNEKMLFLLCHNIKTDIIMRITVLNLFEGKK